MTDKSIKIECPCGVMKHDIHVPILMKLLDKGSCSGCGKTIREVEIGRASCRERV